MQGGAGKEAAATSPPRPAPAPSPVRAGRPLLVRAVARLVSGLLAPETREPRGALAGGSAGPGRLTSGERTSEGLPPQQSGERSCL